MCALAAIFKTSDKNFLQSEKMFRIRKVISATLFPFMTAYRWRRASTGQQGRQKLISHSTFNRIRFLKHVCLFEVLCQCFIASTVALQSVREIPVASLELAAKTWVTPLSSPYLRNHKDPMASEMPVQWGFISCPKQKEYFYFYATITCSPFFPAESES